MHRSVTIERRPTCWRPMPDGSRPERTFCVSLIRVSAGDGRPLSSRLTVDGTSALVTASLSWSSAGPRRPLSQSRRLEPLVVQPFRSLQRACERGPLAVGLDRYADVAV